MYSEKKSIGNTAQMEKTENGRPGWTVHAESMAVTQLCLSHDFASLLNCRTVNQA